jgi:hypothetical protein
VSGKVLRVLGRQLVSHFPLSTLLEKSAGLVQYEEIIAPAVFLINLELLSLFFKTSKWKLKTATVNNSRLPTEKRIEKRFQWVT